MAFRPSCMGSRLDTPHFRTFIGPVKARANGQ